MCGIDDFKVCRLDDFQWHDLLTEFYETCQFVEEGHTYFNSLRRPIRITLFQKPGSGIRTHDSSVRTVQDHTHLRIRGY